MFKPVAAGFVAFSLVLMACATSAADTGILLRQLNSGNKPHATSAAHDLAARLNLAALNNLLDEDKHQLLGTYIQAMQGQNDAVCPLSASLFERIRQRLLNKTETGGQQTLLLNCLLNSALPNIDAPLLALFPVLSESNQATLVHFFSKRAYLPVLQHIKRLLETQRDPPLQENTLYTLCKDVIALANEEALNLALECLPRLSGKNMQPLLYEFAYLPLAAPLDFAKLKQELPKSLPDTLIPAYLTLAGKRQAKTELPLFFDYLRNDPGLLTKPGKNSKNALLRFENTEILTQALGQMEKLKQQNDSGPYRHLIALLKKRVEEPQVAKIERLEAEQRVLFESRRQAYVAPVKQRAKRLKSYHPALYREAWHNYFDSAGKLYREYAGYDFGRALLDEVSREVLAFGQELRFAYKRPEQSLALYKDTLQLNSGNGLTGFWLHFALADQQASADKAQALHHYRQMQVLARDNAENPAFPPQQWTQQWLQQEVAYLEKKDVFQGTVDESHIAALAVLVNSFHALTGYTNPGFIRLMMQTELKGKTLHRRLNQSPPSHFTLLGSLPLLPRFDEPQAVAAYLKKQDPAGLWGAIISALAVMEQRKQQEGVQTLLTGAAQFPVLVKGLQKYRETNRIKLNISSITIASQFATPQKSWEFFIRSLRDRDNENVLSCFSPELAARLGRHFSGDGSKLPDMADSFSQFKLTEEKEDSAQATAVRAVNGQTHEGFIKFVKIKGEWKIDDM